MKPRLPWSVRYALAAYEAGKPLPSWLLLSVQMHLYGGGCAACHHPSNRKAT